MLAAAFSWPAFAQSPPSVGQVLESVRELRVIPSRPDSGSLQFNNPAPMVAPVKEAADGEPHVHVTAFRLSGNTLFTQEALQPLIAEGVGRDLALADIERIITRINDYYHDRGYLLARAYVPAQSIKNGEVEIAIAEGRLGAVKVQRNASVRLGQERIDGVLALLRTGEPVHVPTIERALLLLTDMPGIAVRSTLQPGAASGTADLIIAVDEGRMPQLSFGIDNYGNRYTGTMRGSLGLQLNDVFGEGGQFSFIGAHGFSGLSSGQIGYEFPIGDQGLRMRLSYADLHYRLGGAFQTLGIVGNSHIVTAGMSYPLLRTRDANLHVLFGAENKRLSEKVDAIGSAIYKTISNANLGLTGNLYDNWQGGGALTFGATYSHGDLQRNSNDDAAVDAVTARSAGRFSKFNWHAGRLQRLADRWSLAASLSGQWASKNLDSAEKFYLGGPASVRAYQIGEAAGDEGMQATVELRYDLKTSTPTQFVWFVDGGRVRLNKDPFAPGPNTRSLSGAGVGLNWDLPNLSSVRVSYATRLGGQPLDSDEDRHGRVWLSVAMASDALGVLGANAAPARETDPIVDSKIDVYGTLNVDLEVASRRGATPAGPRGATQSLTPTGANTEKIRRMVSNASNIGFRGQENLGGGLKTWYQIESSVAVDTGSGTFAGRNTGIALESRKWGTLLMGQWDTPYKRSTSGLDPFDGNQVGAFYNVLGTPGFGVTTATRGGPGTTANDTDNDDASFTRRQGNSLQYWTPSFGPFTFRFLYSTDSEKTAPTAGEASLWDVSVVYDKGPLMLSAAYERHKNYYGIASLGRNNRGVGSSTGPTSTTTSKDEGLKLALGYDFGATSIGLVWEKLRYREDGVIPANTVVDLQYYDRSAVWFGIDHKIGNAELFATYGKTSDGHCAVIVANPALQECTTQGLGAHALAFGAQYKFSRRTSMYAQYAKIRNGSSGSYNFSTGLVAGAGVGADPQAIGVGMIRKF